MLFLFQHTFIYVKQIPEYLQRLVEKYLDGTATQEERTLVDEWYQAHSSEVEAGVDESEEQLDRRIKERLDGLVRRDKGVVSIARKRFLKVAAAVIFLIGISGVVYFFLFPPGAATTANEGVAADKIRVDDIAPGGNKATLILGDGTQLVLDSTSDGSLALQGNTNVIKVATGQLEYKNDKNGNLGEVLYNQISTPRAGQYHVTLSDGTKVWLNSASSIRFPTEFRDSVRDVLITGEAYFEVAHNAAKPFRVQVKDTYINVLGTHFNVMAYDNESSINTTLLQGAVKISNDQSSRMLAPGQQSQVNSSGSIAIIKDADIEEAVAWRFGRFVFNSADIHGIMRQVERWYDVDVSFTRDVDLHFTGQLSRDVNVSQLLRKLELTNEIHFKIDKGKITVLP